MDDLILLIEYAILAAFAFFVAAPLLMNAIASFTVQKKFAQTMISEGIIAEDEVKRVQPKKQAAGVVISLIAIVLLVGVSVKASGLAPICSCAGFILGLIRYRKALQFTSLTVKQFQNNYREVFNTEKMNRYIKSHF